ncbi:MAG: hypothetical protein ABJB12_13600 [Pseudomonadota bacterium]
MKSRNATLVVIEFGASWPRWLDPSHSGDMAVVAQHYEGLPSSLLTQVASRVTRLEANAWRLKAVVLVSNGSCEADSVAARSVLARGLLSRLRAARGGHFALTVDQRYGQRARHNLTHLAESLDEAACLGGIQLSAYAGDPTQLWSRGAPALAS